MHEFGWVAQLHGVKSMDKAMLEDPAWLERMYNARAAVPDHMDYLQRWAQTSVQVRSRLGCHLDVAYGSATSELLDIFPGEQRRAPVLVFIHGGYWRGLDKADHSFVAPGFVAKGACVVVVNYALCPGTVQQPVAIPYIVRQMEKALVWVWRHIDDYGGDPQNITLVGHSAGGHLAALLLASAWPLLRAELPEALVRKALSISGLHDLTPIMHTPSLQRDLRLTEQQVMRVSPALLPVPPHAHLHCVVGGEESTEFQRQARLMGEAWGSRHVPRCEVVPGLHHFSILDALADPEHDVHRMALSLLRV